MEDVKMAGKPQYIKALEGDMAQLKNQQQKDSEVLKEIHVCLAGTEFDQDNGNGKGGGLVRRVGRVEKKLGILWTWKTKTVTRNAVIWIIVGGALTAIWSIVLIKFKGL